MNLSLRKYFIFLGAGLLYGLAPEFANQVVINKSSSSFLIYIFLTTPLLMSFAFGAHILLRKVFIKPSLVDLVFYFFSGFFGIGVEWFIIGNSPWQNPDAIQITMFFYWVGLFFFPRVLSDPSVGSTRLRKNLFRFYIVYSVIHLLISFLFTPPVLIVVIPLLWTFVYGAMNILFLYWFVFSRKKIF